VLSGISTWLHVRGWESARVCMCVRIFLCVCARERKSVEWNIDVVTCEGMGKCILICMYVYVYMCVYMCVRERERVLMCCVDKKKS